MFLALLLIGATSCPAGQVEIHGTATQDGKLEVFKSPAEVETRAGLVAGQKWSVCVKSTVHPINPAGFYDPWFDEVHYTFKDGTSKHERWAVPKDVTSMAVEKVVTDGSLK
jgi:hypothetical protein